MKKLLLISVLLCITFLANAQKRTNIYILGNGGINYSTLYQSSSAAPSLNGIWEPYGSISVRAVAPTWWGIEGGLSYTTKGATFPDSLGKVTIPYAGAFFDGLLVFPLINYDDAYTGLGFYTGYALTGKSKFDSTTKDIEFGDTWRAFDFGLQLKAGYMIKNVIGFGVNYDVGFIPAYKSIDRRGDTNLGINSTFTFCVTLRFARFQSKPYR